MMDAVFYTATNMIIPSSAVDCGLITFDEDCRLVLSKHLKDHLPQRALREGFVAYEGAGLQIRAADTGTAVGILMNCRKVEGIVFRAACSHIRLVLFHSVLFTPSQADRSSTF